MKTQSRQPKGAPASSGGQFTGRTRQPTSLGPAPINPSLQPLLEPNPDSLRFNDSGFWRPRRHLQDLPDAWSIQFDLVGREDDEHVWEATIYPAYVNEDGNLEDAFEGYQKTYEVRTPEGTQIIDGGILYPEDLSFFDVKDQVPFPFVYSHLPDEQSIDALKMVTLRKSERDGTPTMVERQTLKNGSPFGYTALCVDHLTTGNVESINSKVNPYENDLQEGGVTLSFGRWAPVDSTPETGCERCEMRI